MIDHVHHHVAPNSRRVFSEGEPETSDRRLRVVVEALGEIEGHPWADWKGGKLITPNALARAVGRKEATTTG